MTADDTDLTLDDFLGGALRIWQPKTGYRAGIDPVLLAASVVAKPGDSLLDLGCGVGVAGLCASRRISDLDLVGLELQVGYADLARRNGQENGLKFEVATGDLEDMPDALKERQFDHVIANPPYFDRRASTPSQTEGRETALSEATPLSEWVRQAAKRVRPNGTVTFVHRAERLPDLLTHVRSRLGSVEVLPFAPRKDRPARLCLVRGRNGGRAEFRLHAPWILHAGDRHETDGENFTEATACVLRHAAHLPFSQANG